MQPSPIRSRLGGALPGVVLLLLLAAATGCVGEPRSEPAEPAAVAEQRRVPGEFERQDALLLSCAQLVEHHPQAFVDIVAATHENIDIVGLVGFDAEEQLARRLLREAGLPADAVDFLRTDLETMWLRDFGPIFVEDERGGLRIQDPHYIGTSRNPNDDTVPLQLAEDFDLPRESVPLVLEGGNLLSNGTGLLLNSSAVVAQNRQRGLEKSAIDRILAEHFGARQRAFLRPLEGEPTKHVDMFCTFASATTLVVGDYDPGVDPENARILDQMARSLAGLETAVGPLEVVRIEMPPNHDGRWRTYTNVVYANGVLLVPSYDDVNPRLNEQAIETYEEILPDWEVVGIDASSLIERGGSLHCITVTIPDSDVEIGDL